MLMTNQLPTNNYMFNKVYSITYPAECQYFLREQERIQETTEHVMFFCPDDRYTDSSKEMIEEIWNIYNEHNEKQEKEGKKIKYDKKIMDTVHMKAILYPDFKSSPEERANIHRITARYILKTRKDLLDMYKKG